MSKSEGTHIMFEDIGAVEALKILRDPRRPRSVKEAALRRIRVIERETGETIYGNYNGRSVCRNPSELARMEEENEVS